VCLSVCLSVCVPACMHIHACFALMCVPLHMHVCMYACTCWRTRVLLSTWAYVCIYGWWCIFVRTCIHTCVCQVRVSVLACDSTHVVINTLSSLRPYDNWLQHTATLYDAFSSLRLGASEQYWWQESPLDRRTPLQRGGGFSFGVSRFQKPGGKEERTMFLEQRTMFFSSRLVWLQSLILLFLPAVETETRQKWSHHCLLKHRTHLLHLSCLM